MEPDAGASDELRILCFTNKDGRAAVTTVWPSLFCDTGQIQGIQDTAQSICPGGVSHSLKALENLIGRGEIRQTADGLAELVLECTSQESSADVIRIGQMAPQFGGQAARERMVG